MVKLRKMMAVFLLITLMAGIFSGCSVEENKIFQSMDDFNEGRIGVLTGSAFDLLAKEYFPEAEKLYYINITDLILNLKQEKINGILMDEGFFTPLRWEDNGLSFIVMDNIPKTEYAVAFPKTMESELLKAQMDEFIAKCTQNGWIDEQRTKWFGASEPDGSLDFSQLTGDNGTLRVATTVECKPFDYLTDGQYCGFDADFIFQFAKEYGYSLEIDTMDFGALLANITAGRYDLAVSGITVTEERKESVLFSEVYYSSPSVMAVHKNEASVGVDEKSREKITDFTQAKIGVITGSSHDGTAKHYFPDAERVYFNSMADMIIAVEQEKIDCYIEDAPFVTALIWEGVELKRLNEAVSYVKNGFVFPQGESAFLREQVNSFLSEAKADGTIEQLKDKWMGNAEPAEHPNYQALTGENGTIRMAVAVDGKPLLYQREDYLTGLEIELLTIFGQKYGYAFDIEIIPFESIIAGIATGKYDMGAATLNITPEREESVDFSDPYAEFDVVLVTKEKSDQGIESTNKLADFEKATLGVLSGSSYDPLARERFPNAERQYYSIVTDMIIAVEQGKIDAYISEVPAVTAALWEGAKIKAVEEIITRTSAGYIFSKNSGNSVVREQLSAFISQSKETGLLDSLNDKWFGSTEPTDVFDSKLLTGENGMLKVAVSSDLKPLCYVKDGAIVGYEIEVLQHFAQEYGYQLEFVSMTFDSILPGVVAGKYDIGAGGMTITEERAQSVDFTESYLTVDVVMVVRADADAVAQTNFLDELKLDFEKTFIRENRWKMIVKGIGVTMLISICAAVAGSLLGFGLYMLSRSEVNAIGLFAKAIAKIYSRIVAGTPVVVILMILFYVIFGKFKDMSGILVAIIGFTLTFGAFVYDHMTVSVGSVDRGQTEAAYALGYTKNKTFFRIIFPQAMTIFLPSYCGQAVELIKATAVVGYIAVNDLTKMGDIIRSNTYEAFFPLIATALIYFLLTWLLSSMLKFLKLRFEPKRRSREDILKGVKTV